MKILKYSLFFCTLFISIIGNIDTSHSLILYDNSEEILKNLSFRGNGKYIITKGNTEIEIIIDGKLVTGIYYSDTDESYIFCFKGVLKDDNIIIGSASINTLEDSNITEPLGEYNVDENLTIIGRQISKNGMLNFESIILDLSSPSNIIYKGESNTLSLSCPL